MSFTPTPFSGPGSPDHNPPQTVEGPAAGGTVPLAGGENPPPGAPRPDSFSIPSALGGLGEILGDAARTVIRIPRIFANAANASAETREARALRAEWNSAAENAGVAENLATLAELLGQYEESQNDGPVLSVALTALELWGTGDADLHRELTDHRLRLSQALESGDDEAAAAAEDEALAWIPRYAAGMLRISGDECVPRELLTFLSEQPAEEIAVVDVAALALEAAFQPYHTGDGYGFLHEMTASVESADYRLAEWSRAYLDTARHWLAWRLDGIYGREALEAGLPPADESHGDDALALTAYFSRPVADAYEAFRSADYEEATALFTDFRRLVRMASVTDRMNTLWDTREITDQYNTQDDLRWNELLWFSPGADHLDQPIGPWDAAFVDSDYFERMRDFGEECFSRLGLLEGMLTILSRAGTTEERTGALRETAGLQAQLEERFGTDVAFYDQLPRTVRDLVENNAARSQMSSLLETVVVSAFTFGTGAVLRNLAEAGRALPWAFRAGEMTRLGRAYSWVRDAALFEGSSLAIDAALDPGRRVSPESSTGANLARTALGYVETVGLFGVLHALGAPFQAAENRIVRGLRLASGWGERLSLHAEDLIVRLSRLGTEASGMAAYSTTFESTVGQVRGLWGDDTFSFAENAAQFFGPESLARNLALIGVMRAVGLIGETLTPRNAAALALLPLSLLDGGLSLAMAVVRGPDARFYDYDPSPGRTNGDSPTVVIPIGPSGRCLFRTLDASRSTWSIGREPGSDVELAGHLRSVSNNHATIRREVDPLTGETRWQLIDHSTNGTVIDGIAVSGRAFTLTPGRHELALGTTVIQLQIPVPPLRPTPVATDAESAPGLFQRIRRTVRNMLLSPLWLFMGAEGGAGDPPAPRGELSDVVSHNLSLLSSREFRQVLGAESFGGNAGPDRAGVNVAVDAEGRIAAIGNPQNLPSEIRQALDEGRYLSVTLSVDLRGWIDWSRCATSDPIPDAAKETLRRSVEEYNARLSAGTGGASGMLAPLLGLSAVLPGLSDAFSFSPFLAGAGFAAALIARRAYEMSDRNRRENRMADSLVRTVHRRLRNELEMNVPLEEIRRTYHEVIAPDFKMGAGGRRNAGDLTAYSEQEEELFAYFAALSEEH
ncbi:MAG TPA: FHA domain-containing protein [bacterium]|nr:FHA domain-containing protein [bacterium]